MYKLWVFLFFLINNVNCFVDVNLERQQSQLKYIYNKPAVHKNSIKTTIQQIGFILHQNKNNHKLENKNVFYHEPKTIQQINYVKLLEDYKRTKIITVVGPAGSGKTLFACQNAIKLLLNGSIKKIIITRPTIVSINEDIGVLPGTLINKMSPWTKPMFDIFLEYLTKSELNFMLHSETIEICPLGFMRGRTFNNCFIIADEMQNSTPIQIKMLMTRLGENSNLIITGDLDQIDIPTENGLSDFLNKLKNYNSDLIKVIKFTKEDICRSIITETIIDLYDKL